MMHRGDELYNVFGYICIVYKYKDLFVLSEETNMKVLQMQPVWLYTRPNTESEDIAKSVLWTTPNQLCLTKIHVNVETTETQSQIVSP